MYSRERAEQIVIEAMRKALRIGFKSVNLGNAHIGIHAKQGWLSTGIFKHSPITVNVFDEGALKIAQFEMLQELFRRYGVAYSQSEAKTMVSALIGSSLTRYAKAFAKSLPVLGNFIDDDEHSLPVLAAAATHALGQAAVLRLEMEQPFNALNLNAMKIVYQRAFEQGKTLSRAMEQGHSNVAVVLDFDAARKDYERACQRPITKKDDPFAIEIEEMPPSFAQAPISKAENSVIEKFENLAALREKGILTEEEFQVQRQKLLNQL